MTPCLPVRIAALSATLAITTAATSTTAAAAPLVLTCANPLTTARSSETIEIPAALLAPLGAKELSMIHVRDASGRELVCQAVDNDFDAKHTPDAVIFQADFAARESKTFTVTTGAKQVHTADQFKAHGRFCRERFDDFAWENDRIAHRTYGKALESWAGEPLVSSTIDIWSKRVPRMVADEWYMTDNYHQDTGLGADFYSAGSSRGCGGTGIWAGGTLAVSHNFTASRVLTNGPLRVMFELDYDAFDAAGAAVTETKRITLDAGSNLNHFISRYHSSTGAPLVCGIGIRKTPGAVKEFSARDGILSVWEPVSGKHGMQGVAILADPAAAPQEAEDKLNHLVIVPVPADGSLSYWAGFCWDQTGPSRTQAQWNAQLLDARRRLAAPITVSAAPAR